VQQALFQGLPEICRVGEPAGGIGVDRPRQGSPCAQSGRRAKIAFGNALRGDLRRLHRGLTVPAAMRNNRQNAAKRRAERFCTINRMKILRRRRIGASRAN